MGGISCIIMICSIVVLFILTDFVFGFPLLLNPVSIILLATLLVSTCLFGTGFILDLAYERKLTKREKVSQIKELLI
ncbi:MAG: hypothetical protein ACFE8M_13745 [Candidatus Hermodarchaeota archaeon]